MTVTQLPERAEAGPLSQDIWPIIGRNIEELKNARDKMDKWITESGGLEVYRIPEGDKTSIGSLKAGDIYVVPLGTKMPDTDKMIFAASYSGTVAEVLVNFRFLTKKSFTRMKLLVPPAPKGRLSKLNEAVKKSNKREDKDKAREGGASADRGKSLYSYDIDKIDAKAYYHVGKDANGQSDDTLSPRINEVAIEIEIQVPMAMLPGKITDRRAYMASFTTEEVWESIYEKKMTDLDDDADYKAAVEEAENITKRMVYEINNWDKLGLKADDTMYYNLVVLCRSEALNEFYGNMTDILSKRYNTPFCLYSYNSSQGNESTTEQAVNKLQDEYSDAADDAREKIIELIYDDDLLDDTGDTEVGKEQDPKASGKEE